MTAARCLICNITIAPFGGRDIATLVLEHLRTHRTTSTTVDHPSNPTWTPGGAA